MKFLIVVTALLICALIFVFLTEIKLFFVNAPVSIPKAQIHKDVIFNQENKLALDLYLPDESHQKPPLIVFFYGGSWQSGSKEQYKFVAAHFIKQGYAVAIPDYRQYPPAKFPDFVIDSAQAVAWLHQNQDQYNYDITQTILMGHSAGAHNAALLTYDKSYLLNKKVDLNHIKSFIGLSGPYAFTPQSKNLKAIFGPPENYPNMRVPNFVEKGDPPALLLHGKKDTIVGAFNLKRLKTAMKEKNVPVTVHYYPDKNHAGTVASFSWLREGRSNLPNHIDDFLDGVLSSEKSP